MVAYAISLCNSLDKEECLAFFRELNSEQYKKEKEAAEISLTDKDDEIAVLQRKIQKLESNNLELRQKLIHSENQKKLFESKYQEAISNSEKSNINIAIEKSDNVAHEAETQMKAYRARYNCSLASHLLPGEGVVDFFFAGQIQS